LRDARFLRTGLAPPDRAPAARSLDDPVARARLSRDHLQGVLGADRSVALRSGLPGGLDALPVAGRRRLPIAPRRHRDLARALGPFPRAHAGPVRSRNTDLFPGLSKPTPGRTSDRPRVHQHPRYGVWRDLRGVRPSPGYLL